jgi:hypothetical protein
VHKALKLSPGLFGTHIHDLVFFSTLKTCAPTKPIAIQKLSHTQNSNNWIALGYNWNVIARWWIDLFGADDNPTTYFHIHHAMGMVGGVLPVVIVIVSIVSSTLTMQLRKGVRRTLPPHGDECAAPAIDHADASFSKTDYFRRPKSISG